MGSLLNRKPENWLKKENKIFSENGSERLQWLQKVTPSPKDWVFPGGSTTISLFEACSFCYVNGQYLAAMILGLSFVEHTLIHLLENAGCDGIDYRDLHKLIDNALTIGLLSENTGNDILEAGNRRNAILPFRRSSRINSVGDNVQISRQLDPSGYEADAKRVMIAVSQFLDKGSI